MAIITEDHLEQQCLEWFQDIGYSHVFAPDLDSDGSKPERSDYRQVILAARLHTALQRLNPGIASTAIDAAAPKPTASSRSFGATAPSAQPS